VPDEPNAGTDSTAVRVALWRALARGELPLTIAVKPGNESDGFEVDVSK